MGTRQQSHQIRARDVSKEALWKVWADVNNWHTWDSDIEYAKLEGPFRVGAQFILKPKNGPKVNIRIIEASESKSFTDLTSFPLAKMFSHHDIGETLDGLELSHTVKMEGPLSFLWWYLVGKNVAAGMPEQAKRMLKRAKSV